MPNSLANNGPVKERFKILHERKQKKIMMPILLILTPLASILLGLSLIAIGGYIWLVAKKMIAGILLLVVGLILTSLPVAVVAFFTVTRIARG